MSEKSLLGYIILLRDIHCLGNCGLPIYRLKDFLSDTPSEVIDKKLLLLQKQNKIALIPLENRGFYTLNELLQGISVGRKLLFYVKV